MDSGSILQFLGHLKAKHVHQHGKWVTASCVLAPWHHDGKDERPSFAVRVEPNKESYFNCFVCKNGKLSDLLFELQYRKAQNLGYDLGAAWAVIEAEASKKIDINVKDWGEQEAEDVEFVMPEEWLQPFQNAWSVPMAREYLQSRDVSEFIANGLDIRWDKSMRTVCFPIRNRDGELVSIRGRRVATPNGEPPYHIYNMGQEEPRHLTWLGEQWVNFDKPVLMVESVFDLASVLRVYHNVVAPLSVGINASRMKRMSKASEVVTMFDQGKGGNKAREVVQHHMGSAFILHVLPSKKDPGELSEAELRNELGPALKLLPLPN